jgi:hypothetical protein
MNVSGMLLPLIHLARKAEKPLNARAAEWLIY